MIDVGRLFAALAALLAVAFRGKGRGAENQAAILQAAYLISVSHRIAFGPARAARL
jgi:hypothetical protein